MYSLMLMVKKKYISFQVPPKEAVDEQVKWTYNGIYLLTFLLLRIYVYIYIFIYFKKNNETGHIGL